LFAAVWLPFHYEIVMAQARNAADSKKFVDERELGCDNRNGFWRIVPQEKVMATKIVVGLAVILVLAVLGTAGMMYVNDSIGVPTLGEVQSPAHSQSSSCASSQDEAPPSCCRQPQVTPISSGGCPAQQQATASVDTVEK
jgi:hypothetical protein